MVRTVPTQQECCEFDVYMNYLWVLQLPAFQKNMHVRQIGNSKLDAGVLACEELSFNVAMWWTDYLSSV